MSNKPITTALKRKYSSTNTNNSSTKYNKIRSNKKIKQPISINFNKNNPLVPLSNNCDKDDKKQLIQQALAEFQSRSKSQQINIISYLPSDIIQRLLIHKPNRQKWRQLVSDLIRSIASNVTIQTVFIMGRLNKHWNNSLQSPVVWLYRTVQLYNFLPYKTNAKYELLRFVSRIELHLRKKNPNIRSKKFNKPTKNNNNNNNNSSGNEFPSSYPLSTEHVRSLTRFTHVQILVLQADSYLCTRIQPNQYIWNSSALKTLAKSLTCLQQLHFHIDISDSARLSRLGFEVLGEHRVSNAIDVEPDGLLQLKHSKSLNTIHIQYTNGSIGGVIFTENNYDKINTDVLLYVNYLCQLSNLTQLSFYPDIHFKSQAFQFLAQMPNLHSLLFGGDFPSSSTNNTSLLVQDNGGIELLSSRLTRLDLNNRYNEVLGEPIKYIAMLKKLQYLNLSGCYQIRDQYFVYLSECKEMKELNISKCCYLSDATLDNIGSNYLALHKLDCSNLHNITLDGIKTLLTKLTDLQYLDVEGCNQIKWKKLTDEEFISLKIQDRVYSTFNFASSVYSDFDNDENQNRVVNVIASSNEELELPCTPTNTSESFHKPIAKCFRSSTSAVANSDAVLRLNRRYY